MMKDNMKSWILCGYEIFSREGLNGLKIEVIARKVKISKSSFYHHFADIECFTEMLLNYHLLRAEIISEKEKLCKNVNPELINLLLEFKQDLLFNRQLRINRNVIQFQNCFEKASKKVSESILGIWSEMLNLKDNANLATMVLNLSLENFYLQITEESLTFYWMENYIKDLQNMVNAFEKNTNKNINIVR